MKFDLILRGGRVADGEGNPLVQADVAVTGDRVAAVGELSNAEAETTIDVSGLVVAPGFIDVHNHAHGEVAGGIIAIPKADNMLRQGVTTIIAGNCGGSPFPMGEHLDTVSKLPIRQNYACLVGFNTVRGRAMAGRSGKPSVAADRDRMRGMVRDAMEEGAVGVSAGYFPPVVTTDDLVEAAKGAAEKGGTYASHIRSEGDELLEAVAEIIEIGERAELPVQISHFKTYYPGNWHKCDDAIRMVEEAHERGVGVLADRYPYIASYGGIAGIVPAWARRKEGVAALSGDERKKLREEMDAVFEKMGGADKVVAAPWETDPEIGGKNLKQIAEERGTHPADVAADLAARQGVSAIHFVMCEENLRKFLAHPLVYVATDGHLRKFGEGTSHPRNYGTFPRVLGKYVREESLMSLTDAVKKMTSMPARQFHLAGRGVLKEGAVADITVFDPDTVADRATFEDCHQYPVGIQYVLVNGGLAVSDGETTDDCLGRVIRSSS